ncbi:MAG: CARDB domain-containing protein, partial [Cyanobacteria bacterium J06623_4]
MNNNNNGTSNFPGPSNAIWESGWMEELWGQLTSGTYSGIGNVVLDDEIVQTETQVLADLDAVDRMLIGDQEAEDLLSDVQRYANNHSFNPGIDPVTGTPEIAQTAESLVQVMQYLQQQGLPDLTAEIGELTLDETALPGDSGRLSITLSNQGGLQTKSPTSLKIYASRQSTPDDSAIEIGDMGFGSLKLQPGESKTVSAVVELPDNLSAGDYHIFVAVDTEGTIPEADEANNVVAATFTQTVAWQFGNIGEDNRQLELYEPDGDVVRFRLKGDGYGEVTEQNGRKQIVVHGTNDKTEINIQADGEGHVLGDVTINGDLKQLYGTKTDLQGNLTVSGSLDRLVLDDVSDAQIAIGHSEDDDHTVDIKLDQVSNLQLTSQSALKTLEAKNWTTEAGAHSRVIAPELKDLKIKGDFIADVEIAGELKKAKVDGVSSGVWKMGRTDKLDLLETTADWSLTVTGELDKLDVKRNLLGTAAAGHLNRVLVKGDMVNAHVLVGADLGA